MVFEDPMVENAVGDQEDIELGSGNLSKIHPVNPQSLVQSFTETPLNDFELNETQPPSKNPVSDPSLAKQLKLNLDLVKKPEEAELEQTPKFLNAIPTINNDALLQNDFKFNMMQRNVRSQTFRKMESGPALKIENEDSGSDDDFFEQNIAKMDISKASKYQGLNDTGRLTSRGHLSGPIGQLRQSTMLPTKKDFNSTQTFGSGQKLSLHEQEDLHLEYSPRHDFSRMAPRDRSSTLTGEQMRINDVSGIQMNTL